MISIRSNALLPLAAFAASLLTGCATLHAAGSESCSEDARIRIRVQDLIDERASLGAPGSIHVQSIGRVVYLSGLVDTGPEKFAAESLAARTPGVARVVNSIEQNN